MDRGGQGGPAGQVLEASHGGKAGGTSGRSAVLAIPDLRVGVGQVRGQAGPQLVVMQAGQGSLGFPPRGGSQSQSEGQPGAGEGSSRQRRCLRAARPAWGWGGAPGTGVGDTLPWGVCSPTPSNRRQLRAGGRGAAVSGGRVLTAGPKHSSGSREEALSPVRALGRPAPCLHSGRLWGPRLLPA